MAEKRNRLPAANAVRLAKIKPDKSLLAEWLRELIVCVIGGHESKKITFYPWSVYKDEIGDNSTAFFVKAENQRGEAFPLPIFMLDLSPWHKEELQKAASEKGLKIIITDFAKPQIAARRDDNEDAPFEGTTDIVEIKTRRLVPLGKSKCKPALAGCYEPASGDLEI